MSYWRYIYHLNTYKNFISESSKANSQSNVPSTESLGYGITVPRLKIKKDRVLIKWIPRLEEAEGLKLSAHNGEGETYIYRKQEQSKSLVTLTYF